MPQRACNTRGFTLIELLVVISIIGVLSSVVMVGVQSARTKAINANIQREIQQLKNEFEQNRLTDGTYPDFPGTTIYTTSSIASNDFTNQKVVGIISDILIKNNGLYGAGTISDFGAPCGSTSPMYGAHVYTSNYYKSNGLTIYAQVAGTCQPVVGYAIYAAKSPISFTGVASTNASDYAGYYCIDSSGNSTSTTSGWIPNLIVNGKCK